MTQTAVTMGCNEQFPIISRRSCDVMRSDEMREDSTFKRHGIRLTSQELVAAKQGGPGRHL